jgi:hypothetical protein
VLKWLRAKFFRSSRLSETPDVPEFKNPEQLSSEEIEWLREDLKFLDELRPKLTGQALRYLVDGVTDEKFFARLQTVPEAGLSMKMAACSNSIWRADTRKFRNSLFSSEGIKKPMFLARLADFYHKAGGPMLRLEHPVLKKEAPWLEVLIREFFPRLHGPRDPLLNIELVEGLCRHFGADQVVLHRAYFHLPAQPLTASLIRLRGFAESFKSHSELIRRALEAPGADNRVTVLELLQKLSPDLSEHRVRIVELAVDSSKKVRAAALAVIQSNATDEWTPLLQQASLEGPSARRTRALKALHTVAGEKAQVFLQTQLDGKPPASVKNLLESILSASSFPCPSEIPPIPPFDTSPPPPELMPLLKRLVEVYNARVQAILDSGKYYKEPERLELDAPEKFFDSLSTLRAGAEPSPRLHIGHDQNIQDAIHAVIELPQLTLLQLLRFGLHTGAVGPDIQILRPFATCRLDELLNRYREAHGHSVTLRQVSEALQELGYEMPELSLHHPMLCLGKTWDDHQIWPYFAERTQELSQLLSKVDGHPRELLLEKVQTFPSPPTGLQEQLWDLALSGVRTERMMARVCLEKVEGFEKRLAKSLSHGKQAVRIAAANWLADLGRRVAVEELRKAASKEKSESAKSALLAALETMGEDIDPFISPESLKKEARKGLKKGLPEQLAWFPFDRLPKLKWRKGGMVEKEVVHWLLVRALKLRDPRPEPMLRRYVTLFDPSTTGDFGLFVLQSFIERDQEPEVTSAIKAKGILSLAGACGDGRVAPEIGHYLKTWHGKKLRQCKAMLGVLASVEDPACLQRLLSVSSRFRTKSLQKEAKRLSEKVAEQKGWTTEELTDRIVPNG